MSKSNYKYRHGCSWSSGYTIVERRLAYVNLYRTRSSHRHTHTHTHTHTQWLNRTPTFSASSDGDPHMFWIPYVLTPSDRTTLSLREIGYKLLSLRPSYCRSQSVHCTSRLDLSWELRTRARTRRILKKFITQNSTTTSHGVFILLKLYTCLWDNIFKRFQSFIQLPSSPSWQFLWISDWISFSCLVYQALGFMDLVFMAPPWQLL